MASSHVDWLRQADADLRLSRHARDGAAHDWACFAAQQAAEKALNPNGLDTGAPTDFYTRKDSDDAVACAERLTAFARDQVEQRSGG